MAKRRFEFSSGSSNKFWEIDVKGSSHTVRYGRIGTDGQSKTKTLASPAKAREAADKLIASKVKKGYVETKGKAAKKKPAKAAQKKPAKKKPAKKAAKSAKRFPSKSSAKRKPTKKASKRPAKKKAAKGKRIDAQLVHAVAPKYSAGSFVGVWESGADLWVIGADDIGKDDDVSTADMIDSSGFVQRWRFKSPKEAKAAAAAIKKQKKTTKGPAPDWVEIDSALNPLMRAKDLPTIARYDVAKSGPLTLTRSTPFDWVHPRPASRCWCGRALMPTYQLSGAVDPRLGKKIRMHISFCPGSLQSPHCEGTIEVIVEHDGAKTSDVVAYELIGYGRNKSYGVLSRSVLWDPIGSGFRHAVTTHYGEMGTPRTVRTETFRTRKEADEYFKRRKPHRPAKRSQFGKWYADVLKERAHFHRVPGSKPQTLRLKPLMAPAKVSGSPYARVADLFDNRDGVGGQPNYTQSDWSDTFDCAACGKAMLFVFQTGYGAPWWCEQLNDGDAGSFQFFACPHCKGPHGRALFECH